MQAWYLIHSKPQQEETALANLERQGFEAFLPRVRATVCRGGRYHRRVKAMFPRYLFVRLKVGEQDWAPIRSTVGVTALVRFGVWPAIVPDDLIEGLIDRCDEAGVVINLPLPDFEPGTVVHVIDGPLAGYRGIVNARNGRERVDVLLDVAGRHARASIDIRQLGRAGLAGDS